MRIFIRNKQWSSLLIGRVLSCVNKNRKGHHLLTIAFRQSVLYAWFALLVERKRTAGQTDEVPFIDGTCQAERILIA